MIVRTWRGRAAASNSDAYARHFQSNVLPELREIEGFLGATLLKETPPDEGRHRDIEFLVLTRWASMDAVRAFAGVDPTRAVVEPEAVAALTEYDRTARHYEVLEAA